MKMEKLDTEHSGYLNMQEWTYALWTLFEKTNKQVLEEKKLTGLAVECKSYYQEGSSVDSVDYIHIIHDV